METEITRKVYGYRRVSTDDQVQGSSLTNQENAIEKYCEEHGFELVKMFTDDGFSAKTAKRPDLQNMLKALSDKNSGISGVVVYNLSRISRNLESYSREIGYNLSARGVHLFSTMENIDDTPTGKMLKNISLSIHQFDNDIKSQTTTDNMHLVALDGWWQGKIPYGYKAKKVPIGKSKDGKIKYRLTLESEDKGNLAEKMTLFLERFSVGDLNQAEIADYAVSIDLLSASGKKFAPQTVKNMLTHMAYAGYICTKVSKYEPVLGRHEALISLATFERNQAILGAKKGSPLKPRTTINYPLKSALLCVNCGSNLRGSAPTTGSGTSSPRYHCASCNGMGSIGKEKVESLFQKYLEDITPTEGTIKLFKKIIRRTAGVKLEDANKQLSDLRGQLSKIDDDMQKALQRLIDEDITPDEKKNYQANLRIKRLEIEERINEVEDVQRLNESSIEYVCNFIDMPSKMWLDADDESKVMIQGIVMPKGITFDIKQEKFGTSGISPLYRLMNTKKEPSTSDDSLLVISRRIELRLPG